MRILDIFFFTTLVFSAKGMELTKPYSFSRVPSLRQLCVPKVIHELNTPLITALITLAPHIRPERFFTDLALEIIDHNHDGTIINSSNESVALSVFFLLKTLVKKKKSEKRLQSWIKNHSVKNSLLNSKETELIHKNFALSFSPHELLEITPLHMWEYLILSNPYFRDATVLSILLRSSNEIIHSFPIFSLISIYKESTLEPILKREIDIITPRSHHNGTVLHAAVQSSCSENFLDSLLSKAQQYLTFQEFKAFINHYDCFKLTALATALESYRTPDDSKKDTQLAVIKKLIDAGAWDLRSLMCSYRRKNMLHSTLLLYHAPPQFNKAYLKGLGLIEFVKNITDWAVNSNYRLSQFKNYIDLDHPPINVINNKGKSVFTLAKKRGYDKLISHLQTIPTSNILVVFITLKKSKPRNIIL